MSYVCAECGREHGDLPRYFMRRLPENAEGATLDVRLESKTLCRSTDGRCFVHCELEFPLRTDDEKPLGFIVWVETEPAVFARLKEIWTGEGGTSFEDLFEGYLANPITCIEDSYGTHIKFKALVSDPTPYIKWVAPGPLKRALDSGASQQFWHSVADVTRGKR